MEDLNQTQFAAIHQARRDLEKIGPSLRNDQAVADVVSRIYSVLGLPEPSVYRFPSPLSAMLAIPSLAAFHKIPCYEKDLQCRLSGPMTTQLGRPPEWTRETVFLEALATHFRRPLPHQISVQFLDSFTDRMGELLRRLGGDTLLAERMGLGLFSAPKEETLRWWDMVGPSGSYWWPYTKFMVLSDAPTSLSFDNDRRLHAEAGPAVEFGDGCRVWTWHGVMVSEKVIARPETITVEEIETEVNAEVQRVMIERMGPGTYLQKTGAELVDMDSLTLEGSAPRALMLDRHENLWLTGTDGSTARVYTMSVPRGVRSCREAHRAICGFEESRLIAEA